MPTIFCLVTQLVFTGCGGREDREVRHPDPDSTASALADRCAPGSRDCDEPRRATGDRGWSIASEPATTIGTEGNPPAEFFHVVGGCRLSDGRIAVANGGSSEIRVFDATGRHVVSMGGPGNGPGEFGDLAALFCHADTLVAFDQSNERVSAFTPGGDLIRSLNLRYTTGSASLPILEGVFADGTLLESRLSLVPANVQAGVVTRTVTLYDLAWSGEERAVTEARREEHASSLGIVPLPFSVPPAFAAAGASVWILLPQAGRLARFARAGDSIGVLNLGAGVAVSDSLKHAYRDWRLANARGPFRKRVSELVSTMPFPGRMPAYSRLLVDAAGILWLQRYRPLDDGPIRWDVFDSTGTRRTELGVPDQLRILDIGFDYVLGTSLSDVGVSQVRIYELLRPPG